MTITYHVFWNKECTKIDKTFTINSIEHASLIATLRTIVPDLAPGKYPQHGIEIVSVSEK